MIIQKTTSDSQYSALSILATAPRILKLSLKNAYWVTPQGGQGSLWEKAAAECRRFAAVHHCRFLEVQPLSTSGTESLLHLLASSNSRPVDVEE